MGKVIGLYINEDGVDKKRCTMCRKYLVLPEFRIKSKRGYTYSMCKTCENSHRLSTRGEADRIKLKKWRAEKGWIGKSCKIRIHTCIVTNELFVTKYSHRKSISEKGKLELERRLLEVEQLRKIELDLRRRETKTSLCHECGQDFKYPKYIQALTKERKTPEYCSLKCSSKSSKRTARLKRKAKLRSVTVDRVNPNIVFAKFNWICCSCGCETPRELRGTYDDKAPELDHIIPISKGGEHSYKNTQLLCRKCNSDKSNKLFFTYAKTRIRTTAVLN